jgi:transposase
MIRRPTGRPAPNAKPWSPKQIAWVQEHAPTMKRSLMAEHLGCSLDLLFRRLKRMGLTVCDHWSPEDDERLRSLAGTATADAIGEKIGRSRDAIWARAKLIGVSLEYHRFWPEEAEATLKRLIAEGKNTHQISAAMNRSLGSIRERIRKLKMKPSHSRRENHPWSDDHRQIALEMTAANATLFEIADRLGRTKDNVRLFLKHHNLRAQNSAYRRQPSTAARPKAPKAEKAPRERVGLPVAIRRSAVNGSVKYCDRCHAPVVDTYERWFEHNLRVHAALIRRIA